jgi:hypothetical protein
MTKESRSPRRDSKRSEASRHRTIERKLARQLKYGGVR